ncbi:hypothetical protein NKH70_34715 [Mesorhizobium sp. M0991]|uniref:hypothetical protein n=1 Tax=Mesorhizobium sp. M0991 TaxID=2957043 RepID=UPI00333561C5
MLGVTEGIASVHDYCCFFVPAVITLAGVESRGAALRLRLLLLGHNQSFPHNEPVGQRARSELEAIIKRVLVAQADPAKRDALERDICAQWQQFVVDGSMSLQVGMMTATARK